MAPKTPSRFRMPWLLEVPRTRATLAPKIAAILRDRRVGGWTWACTLVATPPSSTIIKPKWSKHINNTRAWYPNKAIIKKSWQPVATNIKGTTVKSEPLPPSMEPRHSISPPVPASTDSKDHPSITRRLVISSPSPLRRRRWQQVHHQYITRAKCTLTTCPATGTRKTNCYRQARVPSAPCRTRARRARHTPASPI